jgi:hypothetical protein
VLTEEQRLYGWFQQDLAAALTARISMQDLHHVFGERIVSRGIWPVCLPDLNACDFFSFLGFLKTSFTRVTPERKK